MKKFFAVLLSVILVLTLIGTCLVAYVTSIAKNPATVISTMQDAFENVDYEKVLADAYAKKGANVSSEEIAQDAECVRQLMAESKVVTDSLALYAQDATDAFAGRNTPPRFNHITFNQIAHQYADEMADIVCTAKPDANHDMVRDSLMAYLDKNSAKLVNDISPNKLIPANARRDIADVIEFLSFLEIVLIVVTVVLALLIYLLRKRRFGGFLWVGVNTALAGGLLITVLLVARSLVYNLISSNGVDPSLMDAVVSAFIGSLCFYGGILLVLGAVLIGLFFLLKFTVVRKKKAAHA